MDLTQTRDNYMEEAARLTNLFLHPSTGGTIKLTAHADDVNKLDVATLSGFPKTTNQAPPMPKVAPVKAKTCRCEEYLPTVDQLNYTIHCLQKQEGKLNHALKQVYDTITKLEILREIAKEKESK